ncbi:MAG: TonB-dependent receptor plug domain-containing protein [Bacteroidota bacterium]
MKIILTVLTCLLSSSAFCQDPIVDTSQIKNISLTDIVISVNKTEESKKQTAQQIKVLDQKEIENYQSQTTADLISNSGSATVQKSQLGGGSVTLRGFEANRNVLVIDGVRMNNLIYRAGHLQNILTTDNNSLERIEVLYGPSSTMYGSDALGGVIHLFTKKPVLAIGEQKNVIKVNAFSRYGSAANEFANHLDFNFGLKKFASFTSVTYSDFGDLRGGANKNPFYSGNYGEREYYVERIAGQDSMIRNSDKYLQVQSGYSQYDLLQKFLFQANAKTTHSLNIQFSNSSDVPRYDRLTEFAGSELRFAEWYYGPQTRLLTAYDLNYKNTEGKIQNVHLGLNFQDVIESRHSRRFRNNNLSHRNENVNVYGLNLDMQRIVKNHNIRFGLDGQFNTLKSTANNENISTGESEPLDTRYPDGDNTMLNAAAYISHTWNINDHLILVDGLRVGFSTLHAEFSDSSFFHLPYNVADQNNLVYSGSLGLINNTSNDWKFSILVSSGYRVPNMDDLSKVFESASGTLIVPNSDLKPEKTINGELGISKVFNKKTRLENSIFYTRFFDAIVTDKFTFNGEDSVLNDGTMSQVYANQNKQNAFITGFSSHLKSQLSERFLLSIGVTYTYGRINTDSVDYPLDHIPPISSRLSLAYSHNKIFTELSANFNGKKKLTDYYLNGEDNEQYATSDGMPAWLILNFKASYKVHKWISLNAGVENILDTQYRTFASGINGSGRNFYISLRFNH